MNALAGPNPLEWILLVLLGGGFGMPNAVPPATEAPLAAKVAPEECLFYASWSGTAVPDAESGNQTEQLLAEPEIRDFLDEAQRRMFDLMRSSAGRPEDQQTVDDMSKLLELVQGKPGGVFVRDVVFDAGRAPQPQGGGLIYLGDEAAQVRTLLEKLQARSPEERASSVQIGARSFHRVELEGDGPELTWGLAGSYLVFGLGEGSLEGLIDRARGPAPAWLTTVRSKLAVPRFSSLAYLDVKRLLEIIVEESGEQEPAELVSALELDRMRYFANVSGMDEQGCVSRSLLAVDGTGGGLFAWIDTEPLTEDNLKAVPQDAPLAVAFRLDPSWVLNLWLNLAGQMEPRAADETNRALDQLQAQTGVDVRKDLIGSLGDSWKVFARPGPSSLMTGWTMAVEVRDGEALEEAHATLLALAKKDLDQAGPGGPSLSTESVHGQDVYTLTFPQPGMPAAPSWCLTEDELFIAAGPESIKPLLSEGTDTPTLAEHADVAPLFGSEAKTLAMAYADTRQIAETLLPMLPALLQGLGPMTPQAGDANLPPFEAITRHLEPSVFAVQRTEDGLTMLSRRTLPGANLGASAPVATALVLPAVQGAREAARRSQSTNNMKQIALAMHNFHDTYKAMPAGYSADEEGEPLLSWRVHILPYLEQGELYNQFHLDEPWDSPHNKALIEKMPDVYRAPGSKSGPGKTNYLGVSGADGVFVRPAEDGQTENPRGTRFADIRDGTSNTIMVVEAADDSAVTWTRPGDFSPNTEKPTEGLIGLRPGGFNAGLTDGSVRFISETIDADTLNGLFTKAGGEVVRMP